MNSNDQKLQMLREEKIPKLLLKMGIPVMIGMVVSAFYSVVDAFFVGKLGTSQMGAVSVAYPIFNVIVGFGLTFGTGAGSYISRLLGAGQGERANRTASTAVFTSLFQSTMRNLLRSALGHCVQTQFCSFCLALNRYI